MTNYTPGATRRIPKNLVETAHEDTGKWLNRDELEAWVFRRIAELEAEVEKHRVAEEMQIKLREKADEREAALAAYIEGLKPALEDFANGLGTCCCGDDMNRHGNPLDAGHIPVDSGWYAMERYMREKPDTRILDKRDLIVRAEALEDALEKCESSEFAFSIKGFLHHAAKKLRQQAEQC